MDESAPRGERDNAKRKADAWLKQHQKSWRDASSILAQAAADDAAAAPPPPPSDPRDDTAHPFDTSEFSPVGLVTGILSKYVTMPSDHALIIFALWICFTHVYEQFGTAPRVALVSDEPDSGKTTAKNVAKRLVRRPNPESFGTAAAIGEFIDEGPCTILLDELDQIDREGRRTQRRAGPACDGRGGRRRRNLAGLDAAPGRRFLQNSRMLSPASAGTPLLPP